MQFSVTVADFMRQLSPLAQIVGRRTTLPAMENFLFSLGQDTPGLRAWTTSLDCTLETCCPVTPRMLPVSETFFLAPAKRLMDVLRNLPPGGTLHISLDQKEHLRLECEKTRFRLFSPPPETFPSRPVFPPLTMQIRAGHLLEAIRYMSYAIGDEEARYQLNGGQLVMEFPAEAPAVGENDTIAGHMLMVGTDGHRLALSRQSETLRVTGRVWQQWQSDGRPPASVVIPRRTLTDLMPLLESHEGESIDVGCTAEWSFFRLGGYSVATPNLAGMFPRYDTIVANCPPNEAVMNTADVLSTIRRVNTVTDNLTAGISLSLAAGLLTAQTSSPQTGEALDSVPIHYSGAGITIGINATYLIETLRAVPTRQFRFCFSDAHSQIWIVPHPGEDESLATSCRHIIMPLRLS